MRLAGRQRKMARSGSVGRCRSGFRRYPRMKQLIKSHRFKDPIIGITRITANKLEIVVGWVAAPLMGAGRSLLVRCRKNGWRIERSAVGSASEV